MIFAEVAQWQSNGFVNRRLRVQLSPSALFSKYQMVFVILNYDKNGQVPERSNGPDCKSGGVSPTGVQIPPCPILKEINGKIKILKKD